MKKITVILLMTILLLNVFQPVYAGKKIYKRWWFWPGVTFIAGVIYYCSNQQPEPIDYWADTDGDGMLDYLERQYFGNLDQGPNGDYDGDGWTNTEELNEGGDPTDPEIWPQDEAHEFSIKRIKTQATSLSKKISFASNPTKGPAINIIIPLKEGIWLHGTAIPGTSNCNIQIITRF